MFVGIDVSASRGLDLCVLDSKHHVSLLLKARDLETLERELLTPSTPEFERGRESGRAQTLEEAATSLLRTD